VARPTVHGLKRTAAESGALRDIAEVIGSRQEKALIFTQFRETDRAACGILWRHVWAAWPCPAWRDEVKSARIWCAVSRKTNAVPP